MQAKFHYGFDRMHPGAESVFRFDFSRGGAAQAIICRPFARAFANSSPHIVAAALASEGTIGSELALTVTENGVRNSYKELQMWVTGQYPGVLALGVGLLAGLYPAYYMTSFSPALVLKGSFGLSPKGRQLRNGLVGIQFVASFALIIGFMPDVKFASLRTAVALMAFLVWGKYEWGGEQPVSYYRSYIKVKAGHDLQEARAHVKQTLKMFDPDYLFDVLFYDEVLNRTYEKEQKRRSGR